MSVNGNLMLSSFTGITSSVSQLGLRFGRLSSSLLQNQLVTYLAVELKEKKISLLWLPESFLETASTLLGSSLLLLTLT